MHGSSIMIEKIPYDLNFLYKFPINIINMKSLMNYILYITFFYDNVQIEEALPKYGNTIFN